MASKITKRTYAKLWIVRIIDVIALIGPLAVYLALVLSGKLPVRTNGQFVVIGATAIGLILVIANIVFQKHLRSPIWVVFLGFAYALDKLLPLVITIAICSILDEFIFSPLIRYYKTKWVANRAADERDRFYKEHNPE